MRRGDQPPPSLRIHPQRHRTARLFTTVSALLLTRKNHPSPGRLHSDYNSSPSHYLYAFLFYYQRNTYRLRWSLTTKSRISQQKLKNTRIEILLNPLNSLLKGLLVNVRSRAHLGIKETPRSCASSATRLCPTGAPRGRDATAARSGALLVRETKWCRPNYRGPTWSENMWTRDAACNRALSA